nr:cytochrome p450 82a3 [Quercus suber]
MDFLPPSLNFATIAGLLAIIIFSYHLLKRSSVGLAKTAPIPAGAWPVIGHLPLLGATQTPHITLGAMADKYGPLFTIKLGLHPALVLSCWEMAKECFTTNDLAVSSRPKLVAIKHLCYNYAMFGFAPHGPYWRELRKITTLELLSNHRLKMLSHIRVSEVENDIKDLYKLWIKKKNRSGLILVELKQWFGDMNLNVILRMIAGKRYFRTSDGVNEEEAQRCQKALRDFFHLLGLFVVSDAIPFLGWLDLGGHEKAMKKTAKELDGILGEWLEEHKQKRASSENKGEEDFMDIMHSVLDGAELEGYEADTINKATCLSMIAAGSDTITVTLTWTIALLLNNRLVLKKAQDELDVQVGRLAAPREFTANCIIGVVTRDHTGQCMAAMTGFIAIILFSHCLLKRSRVSLAKTAPIAPGAWPVIGHLPLLLGTQPPHITLGAMADKYGALFNIKIGSYAALVLSNSEIAKEFFTTNDLAVSSRPRQLATKHLGYNYAMFSFGPYGPYWRELRKITT